MAFKNLQELIEHYHLQKNADGHYIGFDVRGQTISKLHIPSSFIKQLFPLLSVKKKENILAGSVIWLGRKTYYDLNFIVPLILAVYPKTLQDSSTLAVEYMPPPKNRHPIYLQRFNKDKVWWKCSKCSFEWIACIYSRKRGARCPSCSHRYATPFNNIRVTHPDLAKQYMSKNKLPVDRIMAGSGQKVFWQCTRGHKWKAKVYSRAYGKGCKQCTYLDRLEQKSLAILYPEIALEYLSTPFNALSSHKVLASARVLVYWKCKHGHIWEASVTQRTRCRTGCPACLGRKPTSQINLQVSHPHLAIEYDPSNYLSATQVIAGTIRKLKWICPKGHHYTSTGANRVKGRGCRICANIKRDALLSKYSQNRRKKVVCPVE